MANSKQIAALVGSTLLVMLASEFPLVQPHLYDEQIPPVVYLSGVLMFVGGLAVVRAHNHWVRDWTFLVTLSGWFGVVLGLFRMFAAGQYQRGSANTSAATFMTPIRLRFQVAIGTQFSGSPSTGPSDPVHHHSEVVMTTHRVIRSRQFSFLIGPPSSRRAGGSVRSDLNNLINFQLGDGDES